MGISRGQRQQIYVSRGIQGVVMGRFALYWFGYHFTLWHGMLLYGYFRGNFMAQLFQSGGMSFWDYYVKFFQLNNGILVCAAAICPILLWDTLRVTHRIAGPVVRFKNALKRLTQGEHVEPIELREKDLMLDLRDAFNEFLATRAQSGAIGKADSETKSAAIDQLLGEVSSEAEEEEQVATSTSS